MTEAHATRGLFKKAVEVPPAEKRLLERDSESDEGPGPSKRYSPKPCWSEEEEEEERGEFAEECVSNTIVEACYSIVVCVCLQCSHLYLYMHSVYTCLHAYSGPSLHLVFL